MIYKNKYNYVIIDKNNVTYFSNSWFGLLIEILWHRFKFWRKGKEWIN